MNNSVKTLKTSLINLALCLAFCLPLGAQTQTSTTSTSKSNPSENGAVISPRSPVSLPNYAGLWQLNHRESQSPSPVFEKTDVTLVVTQDAEQLTVAQKIKLNGHDQPAQPMSYQLSGAAKELPVSRPVAGMARLQARWVAKENRLELRTTIKTTLRDEKGDKLEDVTLTTIEYWELLDGGKALKVVRIREWPDRTESSRLLFEK